MVGDNALFSGGIHEQDTTGHVPELVMPGSTKGMDQKGRYAYVQDLDEWDMELGPLF